MNTLRWLLVSTIAMAGLAACTQDEPNPTFDGGGVVYCSTSDDCATGLYCLDFVCRPAPPDAGQRDYGLPDRRPDVVTPDVVAVDRSTSDAAIVDGAAGDCGCAHPDAALEDALVEDAAAEDANGADL